MEVIRIAGYVFEEKLVIANKCPPMTVHVYTQVRGSEIRSRNPRDSANSRGGLDSCVATYWVMFTK